MIKSHRKRLTARFVSITAIIFMFLIGAGMLLFRMELTNSLDNQLDTLTTELSEIVNYENNQITLEKPKPYIKKQSLGRLARIQLYNRYGDLVEEHGVKGTNHLMRTTEEFNEGKRRLRSKSIILSTETEKNIGYLQVQLPTTLRDKAVHNYMVSMGIMTLVGFVVLSLAGYLFSKEASKPLELSYEMLKQFSADATHELGTPLATIIASIENLKKQKNDPEKVERRINSIDRASKRMNHLLDDLMLLTRLEVEAEAQEKPPELIHLEEIIEQVVDEFEPRFEEQNLAIEKKSIESVKILGYEDNLQRLFGNLLENALRYTDKGKITVELHLEAGNAVASVSDTGLGIPDASIPNLFQRFYRVDKTRSRAKGGSGLGLSIVRAIVEKHNGNIKVESKEEVGTKFIISFPAMS